MTHPLPHGGTDFMSRVNVIASKTATLQRRRSPRFGCLHSLKREQKAKAPTPGGNFSGHRRKMIRMHVTVVIVFAVPKRHLSYADGPPKKLLGAVSNKNKTLYHSSLITY